MQETVHLLRTISENTAKMPAQIFSLFKNSANNNKTTALNDGNRKYSSRVLFLAAEMGNATFIHEVIRQYPHLVWELNDSSQSIFHVAVSYGHGSVYKLLNELGSSSKKIIIAMEDKDGNNMLHLVGEKVKGDRVNNVRGVGMQINPEISWFKEIETIIPPRLQGKKNAAGLTPHQVFIKNHRDLFSKGEDWMKEIATQLMVVAALVSTTSYQVAFQPPGGYNQETADPIYLKIFLFRLFIIFDSLSFTFSTTSILGSNYDEYDFMLSLSKQLDICLGFVFASIVTMVFTFIINFFLFLKHQFIWLPIFISVCAITPFLIFSFSKYHLPSRIMRGFRKLYQPSISARKFHLD
ncbi:ankyrin repeat-containing domain, PGG domain protein [Artemisia annua]|uniref:Ankyrin repeat-containing domain, PGG domain protein n=1 Tax=Artemisia annua TaxID=35608 RepID=A0A2U1L001_ARTAN|nr:ankyrin repeat-containing domain, PGG domain protein [Artemisia annua]